MKKQANGIQLLTVLVILAGLIYMSMCSCEPKESITASNYERLIANDWHMVYPRVNYTRVQFRTDNNIYFNDLVGSHYVCTDNTLSLSDTIVTYDNNNKAHKITVIGTAYTISFSGDTLMLARGPVIGYKYIKYPKDN